MKLLPAAIALALVATACKSLPDYGRPLPEGAPALLPLEPGDPRPKVAPQWEDRADIIAALDQSLAWTKKESSKRFFPIENITYERALASLERMKDLLSTCTSAEDFDRKVENEFTIFKSAGWNGKGGGVLFTGYCTPILDGRLTKNATYRYPLYALPPDLVKGADGAILGRKTATGTEPYPTRSVIEASALLEGQGLELAWLKDPIDAYIAHVNGSAFIRLDSGEMLRLGYSGKNGQRYTSLGQELVKDKKLGKDQVSLSKIREWSHANPGEVEEYLHRNDSFVFFTKIDGNPRGSLNVPVTGNRSLATDKTLFPRGAIVFVDTHQGAKANTGVDMEQFLFDQDTGGAIRTAGRADIYLGVGDEAEALAGKTRAEGQLYYFFLKDTRVDA